MLAACAVFQSTSSALPLEVHPSPCGSIISSTAFEKSGRLYVSGMARKESAACLGRIDVQLTGSDGRIVAAKGDSIQTPAPRPGGGRLATGFFAVSFPLEEARQSAKIRVVHNSEIHASATYEFVKG